MDEFGSLVVRRRKAWLVGMGMATALWCFLALFADIYFPTNDDKFLLRTFAGEAPDGVPTFHQYFYFFYVYPLKWLNQLFPTVAWVSVFEIVLMWISVSVIFKSIILCYVSKVSCCSKEKAVKWAGGVFYAACLGLLFLFYQCARPTFTTTSASLGAAAAAHLISLDCRNESDRHIVCSMSFGLVLLVMCYGMRQENLLPCLAFCGVAFLYQFFTCFGWGKSKKRNIRPLVCVGLIVLMTFSSLFLVRQIEIQMHNQQEHLTWDEKRSSVMDFLDMEKISFETIEAIGWTKTQLALLNGWYTMEEAYSTEAFEYIAQSEAESARISPGAAIYDFRTRSPLIALSFIVLFFIGTGCLTGLMIHKKSTWDLVTLIIIACGCTVMLIYLALQGRLPYRAVLVPVIPAATLVFCLLPACLPEKKWFHSVFAILVATGVACYFLPAAQSVKYVEPKWDYNTFEAMDQIAAENPDLLFIYSQELVNDHRLFPEFPDAGGAPSNLMFWGGWQRGSLEYQSKLEAFGLDGDHFQPKDWLRPEIRYLTLQDEPNPLLVQHLTEQLEKKVYWECEEMDIALKAYRFFTE